eukprot:SAG22_NODE_407_length_10957_cov_5.081691_5_plen_180_part_00
MRFHCAHRGPLQSELTVEACLEGTTDVLPHTEGFLTAYKHWHWGGAASTAGGGKQLVHTASQMCLGYNVDTLAAELRNCSAPELFGPTPAMESMAGGAPGWNLQDGGILRHGAVCLLTAAKNASMLRVNVTVGSGASCGATPSSKWAAPDPANGGQIRSLVGPNLCLAARSMGVFNTGA